MSCFPSPNKVWRRWSVEGEGLLFFDKIGRASQFIYYHFSAIDDRLWRKLVCDKEWVDVVTCVYGAVELKDIACVYDIVVACHVTKNGK